MDRLCHRHALRHLDTDLIERIAANGPQGRKPAPAKPSAKPPRAAGTYRGALRNLMRGSVWHGVKANGRFPFFSQPLNRSSKWKRASSYAAARYDSPSSEPVR